MFSCRRRAVKIERRMKMALIACPECGKQISDTTHSCPHCGYRLFIDTSTSPQPNLSPTPIGEVQSNTGAGIGIIILGIFCLFLALFGFLIFFPIGIVVLGLSIVIICSGAQKISGLQDAYCPHCGKLSKISKSAENFKCPTCKKRSVRDGEYLKPIL